MLIQKINNTTKYLISRPDLTQKRYTRYAEGTKILSPNFNRSTSSCHISTHKYYFISVLELSTRESSLVLTNSVILTRQTLKYSSSLASAIATKCAIFKMTEKTESGWPLSHLFQKIGVRKCDSLTQWETDRGSGFIASYKENLISCLHVAVKEVKAVPHRMASNTITDDTCRRRWMTTAIWSQTSTVTIGTQATAPSGQLEKPLSHCCRSADAEKNASDVQAIAV